MADWYASSVAHAAVPVFAISTGYTVGQFVRRITTTPKAQWVMRCTVAGTSAASEPTWPTTNNGTVVSGGATFANVTGQSTYGWNAAAGDMPTLQGAVGTFRVAAGDRMFVSSDHTETHAAGAVYGSSSGVSATAAVTQVLSVNRTGSVPPVAADLLAGATVNVAGGSNQIDFAAGCPVYHYGINYIYTGTWIIGINFGSGGSKVNWFDTCQLYLNTASTPRIQAGAATSVVLYNTSVRFGATGQTFNSGNTLDITWLNTPSAIQGTVPTALFTLGSGGFVSLTARGVDFSALTTTLLNSGLAASSKCLLDSCRIASAVVRFANTGAVSDRELLELVNCFDGTNTISESIQLSGAVTTELTITLSGGAQDNVGVYSHKMVSNTNVDKYCYPLTGFWLDANYATTGSAKTATVEIISSASLNNDEISLELEYLGTAASSLATFSNSLPATVLTAASAVTASTATWNSSPATPVRQRLQVTFTPRTAGRVRARVRLGKVSTTVYYNPQVTIS